LKNLAPAYKQNDPKKRVFFEFLNFMHFFAHCCTGAENVKKGSKTAKKGRFLAFFLMKMIEISCKIAKKTQKTRFFAVFLRFYKIFFKKTSKIGHSCTNFFRKKKRSVYTRISSFKNQFLAPQPHFFVFL